VRNRKTKEKEVSEEEKNKKRTVSAWCRWVTAWNSRQTCSPKKIRINVNKRKRSEQEETKRKVSAWSADNLFAKKNKI
tara:strand:+ start:243 stop:476 length:234 start_codon:yes stop_codon:yes gene_type:complete